MSTNQIWQYITKTCFVISVETNDSPAIWRFVYSIPHMLDQTMVGVIWILFNFHTI